MRPECIQAINSAAGRVLSKTELNRLEEDIIHQYHKTPLEGLSKAERYRLAGENAQKDRIRETAEAIHNLMRRISILRYQVKSIRYNPGERKRFLTSCFIRRAHPKSR